MIYIIILRVFLSVEGAKNVFCLLRGWGRLAMAFSGKFLYMAHHFILLQLNPFELRVDREGLWFEHSCVIVAGFLISRGCQKRFLAPAILLRGWVNLTMAFTGNFIYMAFLFLLCYLFLFSKTMF